ncbi:hypothetical protein [Solimonas marina]|uniref:Helix-turn-helix domain-containing protein n=1 Tax=Solimonas marina TaxID=2714601 RepID=A0A969W7X9_9GAMM|nr:hypothetical protein [Solimonas marina]NKF21554.1 hypothetical protein [Solimonas marina]
MARIRTVKPDFWKHEGLSSLPEATHMLAAALLNYADDEGYFNAHPGLVKAECCPLREPSVSVHDSISALACIGYLRLGTGNDGRRYAHIVSFDEHQRVNRATPSKIKDLAILWDDAVSAHPQLSEPSLPEGKGREEEKEQGREYAPSSADAASPPSHVELDPLEFSLAPEEPPRLEVTPPVITLPTNTGADYGITAELVADWQRTYPAVDVMAALQRMRAWCNANPKLRKTSSGMQRFVNNWLSREQDRAGVRAPPRAGPSRLQTPDPGTEYGDL